MAEQDAMDESGAEAEEAGAEPVVGDEDEGAEGEAGDAEGELGVDAGAEGDAEAGVEGEGAGDGEAGEEVMEEETEGDAPVEDAGVAGEGSEVAAGSVKGSVRASPVGSGRASPRGDAVVEKLGSQVPAAGLGALSGGQDEDGNNLPRGGGEEGGLPEHAPNSTAKLKKQAKAIQVSMLQHRHCYYSYRSLGEVTPDVLTVLHTLPDQACLRKQLRHSTVEFGRGWACCSGCCV